MIQSCHESEISKYIDFHVLSIYHFIRCILSNSIYFTYIIFLSPLNCLPPLTLPSYPHSSSLFRSYSAAPYIQGLPNEVLVHIFSFLREVDLVHVMLVCRRFNEIANLPSLWRTLFQKVFEMDSPYTVPVSIHNTSSSAASLSPCSPGSSAVSSPVSRNQVQTPPSRFHGSSQSLLPSGIQSMNVSDLSWKEQFSLMVRKLTKRMKMCRANILFS